MLIVQSIPVTARAPWLEARRTRINASEVGTLYGKGKQTTRLQLAYSKLYGEPDKKRDAGVLRRGILLEPACAMAVEHDHGIALSKVRHYLAGHDTDDQRVRVGATLDYDFEMDGGRLLDALHRGGIANPWDDLDGVRTLKSRAIQATYRKTFVACSKRVAYVLLAWNAGRRSIPPAPDADMCGVILACLPVKL